MKKGLFIIIAIVILIFNSCDVFAECSDNVYNWPFYYSIHPMKGVDNELAMEEAKSEAKRWCNDLPNCRWSSDKDKCVDALTSEYDPSLIDGKIKSTVEKIWGTVVVVVQALSVGCVVFAGVRYMFASADQKADIKKGLMYLAIGAIFVFGTITVIDIVTKVFGEVTNGV